MFTKEYKQLKTVRMIVGCSDRKKDVKYLCDI